MKLKGRVWRQPWGCGAEPQKIFEINVYANVILGIFVCLCERLKFKVQHIILLSSSGSLIKP